MYKPTTSCGEIGKILHEIYYEFFGYKSDGVFVEVGAHDGKIGSFTYNLAKLGWEGLYFEPVSDIYQQCVNNHKDSPNVKVFNQAVGEDMSICDIRVGGTLSTLDSETLDIYLKTDWSEDCFNKCNIEMVNVVTLDSVLEREKIKTGFDLLVIDVEGYEDKVLKGFSIDKYRPKMVVIEIPDQHVSFVHNAKLMHKYNRLRTYFKANKYVLLVNDIVDNVYIREDLINYINKDYKTYCTRTVQYKQYIV